MDCLLILREMKIKTLEGEMAASKGEWILKGSVKDADYPCNPDILRHSNSRVAPTRGTGGKHAGQAD